FFFSSRRRHTRSKRDWSSDVCSSDLVEIPYVWLFVALMTVAAISVVNSWLFWDPNVGTSMERGSGHRWIGYQVTALYFLATPFLDRKSTRLNSSHVSISYAVFCLKKK